MDFRIFACDGAAEWRPLLIITQIRQACERGDNVISILQRANVIDEHGDWLMGPAVCILDFDGVSVSESLDGTHTAAMTLSHKRNLERACARATASGGALRVLSSSERRHELRERKDDVGAPMGAVRFPCDDFESERAQTSSTVVAVSAGDWFITLFDERFEAPLRQAGSSTSDSKQAPQRMNDALQDTMFAALFNVLSNTRDYAKQRIGAHLFPYTTPHEPFTRFVADFEEDGTGITKLTSSRVSSRGATSSHRGGTRRFWTLPFRAACAAWSNGGFNGSASKQMTIEPPSLRPVVFTHILSDALLVAHSRSVSVTGVIDPSLDRSLAELRSQYSGHEWQSIPLIWRFEHSDITCEPLLVSRVTNLKRNQNR